MAPRKPQGKYFEKYIFVKKDILFYPHNIAKSKNNSLKFCESVKINLLSHP